MKENGAARNFTTRRFLVVAGFTRKGFSDLSCDSEKLSLFSSCASALDFDYNYFTFSLPKSKGLI